LGLKVLAVFHDDLNIIAIGVGIERFQRIALNQKKVAAAGDLQLRNFLGPLADFFRSLADDGQIGVREVIKLRLGSGRKRLGTEENTFVRHAQKGFVVEQLAVTDILAARIDRHADGLWMIRVDRAIGAPGTRRVHSSLDLVKVGPGPQKRIGRRRAPSTSGHLDLRSAVTKVLPCCGEHVRSPVTECSVFVRHRDRYRPA